jgi:Polyketide cyclase / dehydrase and lipid transport
MYRVEASTVVERSAEDIWAYIADLSMLKAWDHDVLEVRWTAPARLEQTFTIVVDLVGGRPLVGDAGIVTCEPGRRIGWEARPQAPGWVTGGGRSFLIGTYITEPISRRWAAGSTMPSGLCMPVGAIVSGCSDSPCCSWIRAWSSCRSGFLSSDLRGSHSG